MATRLHPSVISAGFHRIRVYPSAAARQGAIAQLRAVGFTYFADFKDVRGFGLSYGHAPPEWPDPVPNGFRWSRGGSERCDPVGCAAASWVE